jgi:sulfide:quinone oxidoreductase
MSKRVVILGAGIGGIAAAHELMQHVKGKHEVLLIDRSDRYEFSPSYLWMLNATRRLDQITVPISRVERKGLKFLQATVQTIDPTAKIVVTDRDSIQADFLVIALGATTHMNGLESVAKAGHNLYTSAGAQAIQDLGDQPAGRRVAVLVCSMPFKCPAAPYEAAMLWQTRLNKFRPGTQVSIYTPEPGPMPVAGEKVSNQLVEMLRRKGIIYYPKHAVVGMDSQDRLDFGSSRAEFDYLAYVPKHAVPSLLVEAGFAAANGWVGVDRHTMCTKFPGVYAVGDCVGISLANGKPLPKAGTFAHGQAETAARNIVAELEGRSAQHRYNGHGQCFVEMGGWMAGRGGGDFYAEPNPSVKLAMPGPWNHLGKVMFEKFWLNKMY